MVRQMDPDLTAGQFAFLSCPDEVPSGLERLAIGIFREAEGTSLIVPSAEAPGEIPMRRITLRVNSALDGVGLTAAVSAALARKGIPANVVAAYHHDHVFVPAARAEAALEVLRSLAAETQP